MSDVDAVARSALAGAATGGRTFTGLAALVAATPVDAIDQPDRTLARSGVKAAIGLAAVGELVLDKLPSTPSRLELPGLPMRVLAAAACGVIVSRRRPPGAPRIDPEAPSAGVPGAGPSGIADEGDVPAVDEVTSPVRAAACAGAAVAAALGTAWLGVRWRSWCEPRLGDLVGALLEDGSVVGAAFAATRT